MGRTNYQQTDLELTTAQLTFTHHHHHRNDAENHVQPPALLRQRPPSIHPPHSHHPRRHRILLPQRRRINNRQHNRRHIRRWPRRPLHQRLHILHSPTLRRWKRRGFLYSDPHIHRQRRPLLTRLLRRNHIPHNRWKHEERILPAHNRCSPRWHRDKLLFSLHTV